MNDSQDKFRFVADTIEHRAELVVESQRVHVYQKDEVGITLIGIGDWTERGLILGSGVNCGVLVRLEEDLRRQVGIA